MTEELPERTPVGLGRALVVLFACVAATLSLPLLRETGLNAGSRTLVAELVLGAICVLLCRPVARAAGGWGAAFGLRPPVLRDAWAVVRWFLASIGARIVVAVVVLSLLPAAGEDGAVTNVRGFEQLDRAQQVLVAVAAVLLAPLVEELLFRGVVLQALAARLGFGPAALLSSLAFGLVHAHQGTTPAGAVLITSVTGTVGLVLCACVRRTGSLTPAIGVHALSNAGALSFQLLV